jgi:hypothetical protein
MTTPAQAALRARIAQLAAEGREAEREAAAWQLAELVMRGSVGFNPHRRPPELRIPRLRYPVIEVN